MRSLFHAVIHHVVFRRSGFGRPSGAFDSRDALTWGCRPRLYSVAAPRLNCATAPRLGWAGRLRVASIRRMLLSAAWVIGSSRSRSALGCGGGSVARGRCVAPAFQPRSGGRIQPGAAAPGSVRFHARSPGGATEWLPMTTRRAVHRPRRAFVVSGRHSSCCRSGFGRPSGAIVSRCSDLGLSPQALFGRRSAAELRCRSVATKCALPRRRTWCRIRFGAASRG